MPEHALLQVRTLKKSFSAATVFEDVSFEVTVGEAVAIVGPNGAGKSTLLNCIVGADAADSGDILLHGSVLDESAAEVRSTVASLLEDMAFFPDLSVVEHLRLFAWSHGSDDPDGLVDDLLQELHLNTARHHLPAALSSGQAHRLGLGSCFARPRGLLVLDEPEARLDTDGRAWLEVRLRQEKEAGVGVLFASHSESLVENVADKVVRIS